MTSKRTLVRRSRREPITSEILALFHQGCELQAEGYDDVDAEGPQADEFRRIDKRLNWTLLGRAPHEVSVFDNLDGDPPAYMQGRSTPSHPDFNGWYSGRVLKQRLMEALAARRARK